MLFMVRCAVIGCAAVIGLVAGAAQALAQPPLRVDGIYPRQLPRGETTTISLAIPTLDAIESIDVSPAAGVTVSALTRGEEFQGNNRWWTVAVAVAPDVAPGGRTLNLHLPAGRVISTGLTIPARVPRITALRLASVPAAGPPAVDVEFAVTAGAADLGSAPYVWFMVACDETPLPGVLRGAVAPQGDRALVRVRIPRQLPGHTLEPGTSTCDVQVRLTDAAGMESNTLAGSIPAAK